MLRTLRFLRPNRRRSRIEEVTSSPLPEPDHAWKALSLVNEWIRHSDAKAGVTLAFVGALATMLFNLLRIPAERNVGFILVVVGGCGFLLLAAVLCGLTLTPRVNDRDAVPEAINRLFFKSISAHFSGDRPGYAEVLSTLTSDRRELVKDLAHQIHANARIATVKGELVKWAIRSALVAGACVGGVAALVGLSTG